MRCTELAPNTYTVSLPGTVEELQRQRCVRHQCTSRPNSITFAAVINHFFGRANQAQPFPSIHPIPSLCCGVNQVLPRRSNHNPWAAPQLPHSRMLPCRARRHPHRVQIHKSRTMPRLGKLEEDRPSHKAPSCPPADVIDIHRVRNREVQDPWWLPARAKADSQTPTALVPAPLDGELDREEVWKAPVKLLSPMVVPVARRHDSAAAAGATRRRWGGSGRDPERRHG